MAKRKKSSNMIAAAQGEYKVGHCKPPKEHQFKPGQSGNPKGAPVRRINLWVHFCKFMKMTQVDVERLDREKLTLAQQTALHLSQIGGLGHDYRPDCWILDRRNDAADRFILEAPSTFVTSHSTLLKRSGSGYGASSHESSNNETTLPSCQWLLYRGGGPILPSTLERRP